MPEAHNFIDTGENSLQDLLEDEDDEKEEEENQDWELIKEILSSKKRRKDVKLPEVLELKLPLLSKT